MIELNLQLPYYFTTVDRIHRIGQTRKVTVVRFVMKNSIEERMVALQEAKSMQAKGAMQKLKADEARKARVSELRSLLLLNDDETK
jgi:SNF2 family DNA or RNA helicase